MAITSVQDMLLSQLRPPSYSSAGYAGGAIDALNAANNADMPGIIANQRAIRSNPVINAMTQDAINNPTPLTRPFAGRAAGSGARTIASSVAPTAAATNGTVANAARVAATNSADDLIAQFGGALGATGNAVTQTGVRGAAPGLFGKIGMQAWKNPGMLKLAAPGVVGTLAGGLLAGQDIGGENSGFDRSVSPALSMAGLGAGIGMGFGPIGAAVGGGLGLAAGGLYGYFTGDKTTKQERMDSAYNGLNETIQTLGSTYGLDSNTMANIMLEFDAGAQIAMSQGDEEALKSFVEMYSQTLPQQLLQYRIQQETERKQNERLMGLQQQFAPIFQSIIGSGQQNAEMAYSQALNSADALAETNPQLAALVRSNAANSRSSSDAMMAAYASQIALGTTTSLQEQMMLQQNVQPVSL